MSKKFLQWQVSKEEKSSRKLRQRLLIDNGNKLLEELVKSSNGKYNPFRVFSEEEIKETTENFHERFIIREDYFYDLYKGVLGDRLILVKKYRHDHDQEMSWSINEIVISSLVNHKNILRLLGCCLETKTPVLVYEYPSKGILPSYIFKHFTGSHLLNQKFALSWDDKLRIANQMAYAFAYLHTFMSTPIIHMSMRITNIYLDEQNVAKLCGLEFSMQIPPGEKHVKLQHQDTIGFVAPETIETNKFTEKNDVFGFGAILMEIVTGKNVTQILAESGIPKLSHANISEDSMLELMFKDKDFGDARKEHLKATIKLSLRCLKRDPEQRPEMKEVAEELLRIKNL